MLELIGQTEPSARPSGNRLDRIGDRKRVLRAWQTAFVGPGSRSVEFMHFGADGLRPLLFLHSLEYPNAPAWGFCVDAAAAGFSTLAIRRPGFGATSPAGSVDDQAALIAEFLEEAGLENLVLVAVGSGCPVGYRLAARCPRVTYSMYVNCVFNRNVMREFRPHWIAPALAQAIQTPAGARLSLAAFRQVVRRFGARRFYETLCQKSPGDVAFARTFGKDLEIGWKIGSAIHSDTFRDEMRQSLDDDPFLTDGALANLRGLALSGAETTESWRSGFEAEARRVGLPFGYLPSGDVFAAYQSGRTLLELIREHA